MTAKALYNAGPLSQTGGGVAGVDRNLRPVDAYRRKIVDQQLAVDDRRANVAAARGVDERRVRIRSGRQVRAIAVDDDPVRLLADLERANLVLEAERLRARAGRHPEDVARWQHARLPAHRLQHGGGSHLFEHVEA